MNLQLNGKVALVTGAASGIGRASAMAFAREGARVAVSDVSIDGGQETVNAIKQYGGEAIFVKADVSKDVEVNKLIETVVKEYGGLDYAHNNAGLLGSLVGILQYDEETWDRVMSVNVKGVWLCMKYEIPQMLRRGKGAIVNTSSIAGLVGNVDNPAYHASKHAVIGLSKVAALEFANNGIRVNAICPGIIDTPMVRSSSKKEAVQQAEIIAQNPIGRLGKPEEIAESVIWLCSDSASFITGHALVIDGGLVAR